MTPCDKYDGDEKKWIKAFDNPDNYKDRISLGDIGRINCGPDITERVSVYSDGTINQVDVLYLRLQQANDKIKQLQKIIDMSNK